MRKKKRISKRRTTRKKLRNNRRWKLLRGGGVDPNFVVGNGVGGGGGVDRGQGQSREPREVTNLCPCCTKIELKLSQFLGGSNTFLENFNGKYYRDINHTGYSWMKQGRIELQSGDTTQEYEVHIRKVEPTPTNPRIGEGWTIGLVLPPILLPEQQDQTVPEDPTVREEIRSQNIFRENTMFPICISGEFVSDEFSDQDKLREGDNKFLAINMAETARFSDSFEAYVNTGAQLALNPISRRNGDVLRHISRYREQVMGGTEDITPVLVKIWFE